MKNHKAEIRGDADPDRLHVEKCFLVSVSRDCTFNQAVVFSNPCGFLLDSYYYPSELGFLNTFWVPRRFQWYIAEGMLSLPTAKWSMVISFFSGVMASGFAFGCAKDTVEFFNAGIGEVRFPVGEGFLLVIFDYVGPWV